MDPQFEGPLTSGLIRVLLLASGSENSSIGDTTAGVCRDVPYVYLAWYFKLPSNSQSSSSPKSSPYRILIMFTQGWRVIVNEGVTSAEK